MPRKLFVALFSDIRITLNLGTAVFMLFRRLLFVFYRNNRGHTKAFCSRYIYGAEVKRPSGRARKNINGLKNGLSEVFVTRRF